MSRKKARSITRLEVLSAAARDNKQEATATILDEIRRDLENIWEIPDIVAKAKAGKAWIGEYEFNRKVEDLAEVAYTELALGCELFEDLPEEEQQLYCDFILKILSMLE